MVEHEHLQQAALLVYANKQDLKGALTLAEISDALRLTSLKKTTQWHIQASCALTGEGYAFFFLLCCAALLNSVAAIRLNEGLDWLVTHLPKAS